MALILCLDLSLTVFWPDFSVINLGSIVKVGRSQPFVHIIQRSSADENDTIYKIKQFAYSADQSVSFSGLSSAFASSRTANNFPKHFFSFAMQLLEL